MSSIEGGSSREVVSRTVDRPQIGRESETSVELSLPANDHYRLDVKLFDQPGGVGTIVSGVRHEDLKVKPGDNLTWPTTLVLSEAEYGPTESSQPANSRLAVGEEVTVTWKTMTRDRAEVLLWEGLKLYGNPNLAVLAVDFAPLGYPSNRIQLRALAEGASTTLLGATDIALGIYFHVVVGPSSFNIEPLLSAKDSEARAVSADGSVVAGVFSEGETSHIFRWSTAEGVQQFGSAPKWRGYVIMSDDGNVLTGNLSDRFYLWTPANGLQERAPWPQRYIDEVSGDGRIIRGRYTYEFFFDTIYYNITWQPTDQFGVLASELERDGLVKMSRDGSVILGVDAFKRPFLWTAANGKRTFGPEGDARLYPNDLSSDGSVVVGYSSNRPFRWTESGGVEELGLPSFVTRPYSCIVSGDGNTVVINSNPLEHSGIYAPYVSRNSGEFQFVGHPFGFVSTTISDINYDGSVVVGTAYRADGTSQAFRAQLP